MRSGRVGAGVLAAMLVWADAAPAGAPAESLRPDARPDSTTADLTDRAVALALAVPSVPSGTSDPVDTARPEPRPVHAATPRRVVLAVSAAAVRLSPRPDARPENLKRRSIVRAAGVRAQPAPMVMGKAGAVCGDAAIRGQRMSSIPGRLRGCGVAKPVRVTHVDGVALTQPATLTCDAARSLKHWVKNSVKPAVGRLGGGVASLKVAAHYACRTRNNQPGAKISEHGRGKAIDISAINLKNGVAITVLRGWRDPVQSKVLRAIHRQACGPFGTVLGPNADRFHQDHFHLDVARHRGGAYCR